MNWKKRLRHYYGACRLTLSGDISLAPAQGQLRYELAGEKRQRVLIWIKDICEMYPFLQIQIKDGIREAEISIFAFFCGCADKNFIASFCQSLKALASLLQDDAEAAVTMNFSGTLYLGRQFESFRILNKEVHVQYKITQTKQESFYKGLTRSRYVRIGFTIILVMVLLLYGWEAVRPVPVGKLV